MPGIVDHLLALEPARMIGDDLVVEQNDDPIGIGAHEHAASGGPGVDAVLVAIMGDQAGGRRPHRLLDEAGERSDEGVRLARSSSNTSQIVRSRNWGCRVRWA